MIFIITHAIYWGGGVLGWGEGGVEVGEGRMSKAAHGDPFLQTHL